MQKNKTTGKAISLVLAGLVFAGATALAPVAMAQGGGFKGPKQSGGYTGPGPEIVSIKEAAKLNDDAWVTFQGRIINQKGDDKYTFQDDSGTGVVEIDRKAWHGVEVGPNDYVQLLVEVDKDWGAVEFEVERVTVIKK